MDETSVDFAEEDDDEATVEVEQEEEEEEGDERGFLGNLFSLFRGS